MDIDGEITACAASGLSRSETAREVGRSRLEVWCIANRLGLSFRDGRKLSPREALRRHVDALSPLDAVNHLLALVDELTGNARDVLSGLDLPYLTPMEDAFLRLLLVNSGRYVTSGQLQAAKGPDLFNANSVTVGISRLRKKLPPHMRITRNRNIGWILEIDEMTDPVRKARLQMKSRLKDGATSSQIRNIYPHAFPGLPLMVDDLVQATEGDLGGAQRMHQALVPPDWRHYLDSAPAPEAEISNPPYAYVGRGANLGAAWIDALLSYLTHVRE